MTIEEAFAESTLSPEAERKAQAAMRAPRTGKSFTQEEMDIHRAVRAERSRCAAIVQTEIVRLDKLTYEGGIDVAMFASSGATWLRMLLDQITANQPPLAANSPNVETTTPRSWGSLPTRLVPLARVVNTERPDLSPSHYEVIAFESGVAHLREDSSRAGSSSFSLRDGRCVHDRAFRILDEDLEALRRMAKE